MKLSDIRKVEQIVKEDIPCDRLSAGELMKENRLLREFIVSYFTGEWEDEYHTIRSNLKKSNSKKEVKLDKWV